MKPIRIGIGEGVVLELGEGSSVDFEKIEECRKLFFTPAEREASVAEHAETKAGEKKRRRRPLGTVSEQVLQVVKGLCESSKAPVLFDDISKALPSISRHRISVALYGLKQSERLHGHGRAIWMRRRYRKVVAPEKAVKTEEHPPEVLRQWPTENIYILHAQRLRWVHSRAKTLCAQDSRMQYQDAFRRASNEWRQGPPGKVSRTPPVKADLGVFEIAYPLTEQQKQKEP